MSHFINIKFAFENPLLCSLFTHKLSFSLLSSARSVLNFFSSHFLHRNRDSSDPCFAFVLLRNLGLKFEMFCYCCCYCFAISTNLQLFDKQEIREIDWNHWNGCTLSQRYIESHRIASYPTYCQQQRSKAHIHLQDCRTIQLKACNLFLFVRFRSTLLFSAL